MVVQKVLIVWSNPLFYETVRLLLIHPKVEVGGVAWKQADMYATMEDFRPNAIIVEAMDTSDDMNVEALTILGASPWDPRVIRLSLEDNELWLYRREQRIVEQADDLLQMILNG